MKTKSCYSIALLICFCQFVVAQELRIVAPPGLETTDGNRSVPNDANTVIRTQELWSASYFSDLPPGGAWLIGMASRLDKSVTAESAFSQNLELSISTSPRDTISLTYDENVGDDVVQAFVGIDAGETAVSGGSVNPFALPLMFETPFFYDPAKGDLLMDYKIDGGFGNFVFDSHELGRPVGNFGPINGRVASTRVTDHIITQFVFDVPEPSTFVLSVIPLGLLLHWIRNRSRHQGA